MRIQRVTLMRRIRWQGIARVAITRALGEGHGQIARALARRLGRGSLARDGVDSRDAGFWEGLGIS